MLRIYTDGSSHIQGEDVYGGWAFVVEDPARGFIHEECGAGRLKTGAAEVTAIMQALCWYEREGLDFGDFEIVSDSTYALKAVSEGMYPREDAANRPLVVYACGVLDRVPRPRFVKVAGHSGDKGNERAHTLAGAAMRAYREVAR